MNQSAIRQQLAVWGLILFLWSLLVLAFAGQLVFAQGLEWAQAVNMSLHDWFPWAPLAPAVAWLASRFPFERGKLFSSIPTHVVACVLAVLFCELLTRPTQLPSGLPGPLGGPPPGLRGEFPEQGPPFAGGQARPGEFRPGQPPFRRGDPRQPLGMRARFNLPIYWIIVSIVNAFTYHRRSQEREHKALELEARLAEAKLQALRMQLHPHFLFNTLHAISTLVHKDPNAADEMIGNLSELLRVTLDTSDQQEVALSKELEFLDRYLEIQQVRFGPRLRIEKQIDAGALQVLVPTLILQPLVENAIRHGLETQPTQGMLTIKAACQGGTLHLTVRDNGGGMKKSSPQQNGIGLANTKARLQALYGNLAQMTITSASEGGCTVALEIPRREDAATSQDKEKYPTG
jgi:two-component sensor histidine kinase